LQALLAAAGCPSPRRSFPTGSRSTWRVAGTGARRARHRVVAAGLAGAFPRRMPSW